MLDLSSVTKIYEETDSDIVNALLSTKKCRLLATSTNGDRTTYAVGYFK